MRTTLKQERKSNKNTRHQPLWHSHDSSTTESSNQSISTSEPMFIQRSSGCSCGGECPSCKAKEESEELEALGAQTKLRINEPGDIYEQQADRVADQVMRMPDTEVSNSINGEDNIQRQPLISTITPLVQRQDEATEIEIEEETIQAKEVKGQTPKVTPSFEAGFNNMRGSGQPLSNSDRNFFEPRFGVDFSSVRVHTGNRADASARAVRANAFTRGSDIVFRGDQYHPHSYTGRQLLAHELTHVVQQGAAPRIQHRSATKNREPQVKGNDSGMGMFRFSNVVQRVPGDGMLPPGDCSWATYLVLRGSVETAKAVVSTLGRCRVGDSCLFLATKIAAVTAEIAARVAVATTCFRGGDTDHQQQIQDKINMMNRCYRYFVNSGCPPALIAAMAVVVERARAVIAAAAVVVAIALVVALIVAIIALAEVIAALLAAAAEGAAILAAVTAVIALLVLIKEEVSPDESSSA